MFSGIISRQIKVSKVDKNKDYLNIFLEKPKKISLKKGESVSLDGVCSTVISYKKYLEVYYMKETLSKTRANLIKAGDFLNFEESLRMGEKNSGHFVMGHVDCTGIIKKIRAEGESKVFEVSIPKEFMSYVVYKGSVAINGVSLTISSKNRATFEVSLIPHTLKETNLGVLKVGDIINIETDILTKYSNAKGHTKQ